MNEWMFTVGAHMILVIAYAFISYILFVGNTAANQWRTNPLAAATFAIFVTCGIGHGFHALHAVEPYIGLDSASAQASRVAMSDPLLLVWSGATAMVALWYLSMRGRLRLVSIGAPLCEDMESRQAAADAMRRPIDAAVDRAAAALDAGDTDAALAAIDEAFGSSREVLTQLIGETGGAPVRPGDLRRDVA